ncbi:MULTISPECIES: hypothetical protein [unclassified Actinobaculum]|uniref:hypothetical protein n=1 Tax=unclassified Actinobaculum TaxID=2609299 RepID=UPI000D5295D0|nr:MULTISPECIES: hypothetical protein [unclassified Actinobaculum]AWE42571.1 hypothetical protein DDD63_07180 [Actinobaculum sp. 313]RTE48791.1 hypothetical protein EKN07_08780 [Actinobaculum sp. 352]
MGNSERDGVSKEDSALGVEAEASSENEAPEVAVTTATLDATELEQLHAIQRRRMIIALVCGLVLLVLGFLAGRHARESRAMEANPTVYVGTVVLTDSSELPKG